MKVHSIDAKALENGWIDGKIDDLRFQAKVYDIGSKFGIQSGRVSKLEVWDEKPHGPGKILAYDRGWSKKPATEEQRDILRTLLRYFMWYPASEYWEGLAAQKPFRAKMRLEDGSCLDTRIAVSADGRGTALDLPKGVRRGKLDPIAVWELKLCEAEGRIPVFNRDPEMA